MSLTIQPSVKNVFQKTTIVLALTALLNGCVTGDLSRVEDAKQATIASLPDIPKQWAALEVKVGDVEMGWLEKLQDPILDALVSEAQSNNKNLQALAASVDGARALSKQAASALSPLVAGSVGNTGSGMVDSSGSNSFSAGLDVSWEADLWGRLGSGNLAAIENTIAAEAEYKYAQYSLAAGVTKAYLVAKEANIQLDIAQKNVDTVTETNRIVKVQFDNGLAGQQEVSLAKADLASAQDSLISSKAGLRDATRSLELLLGRYPSAELAVENVLPALPDVLPAGIPSEILERRPDLIAAERQVAAAFNQVDAAQAAKLPRLSLSSSIGGSSSSLSDVLNPANLAWQAVANIAAPLFDGGYLDAVAEEATANQKAAVASYAQTALNAFAEVEQALDQGSVLRDRKQALTTVLSESETALKIANLQYDEGEISLLDVLTIQQAVFAARSNLLSIERSSLTQFVDLHLALGGSW
ncbi:efflux transporter outer membrane subunit [uncultured Paraglaciecola sp.]|uniref:efflux transporter outer membrane subunit n=1 Tax=uncultured Paraglaciecola sp. TaxID=1765024 RepID=UPI002592F841|nr:efflux transporter outer membrane subunit [uncultured Paraglaciecola sp.]